MSERRASAIVVLSLRPLTQLGTGPLFPVRYFGAIVSLARRLLARGMANHNRLQASLFILVSLALGACNEGDESGGETCNAFAGDACIAEETRACVSDVALPSGSFAPGLERCEVVEGCGTQWSGSCETCSAYEGDACTPEETRDCISGFVQSDGSLAPGKERCLVVQGCETKWSSVCEFNTPIVLSFDGSEPKLVADPLHRFDLGAGTGIVTDWVSAATPWLAMDRNGNGSIDNGTELFGSMTPLAAGGRGRHGFTALRELDADGDGALTPLDPGFAKLELWRDGNGDRVSATSELVTATTARIVAIDLSFVSAPVCDDRGNCAVERAPFYWLDERDQIRSGSAIDVHFAVQPK